MLDKLIKIYTFKLNSSTNSNIHFIWEIISNTKKKLYIYVIL